MGKVLRRGEGIGIDRRRGRLVQGVFDRLLEAQDHAATDPDRRHDLVGQGRVVHEEVGHATHRELFVGAHDRLVDIGRECDEAHEPGRALDEALDAGPARYRLDRGVVPVLADEAHGLRHVDAPVTEGHEEHTAPERDHPLALERLDDLVRDLLRRRGRGERDADAFDDGLHLAPPSAADVALAVALLALPVTRRAALDDGSRLAAELSLGLGVGTAAIGRIVVLHGRSDHSGPPCWSG